MLPALQIPTSVSAKAAPQNEAALAMLEQAAAQQRGSFSASELGEILTALDPVANAIPDGETGNGFAQLLTELAGKRASGSGAFLVVVQAPGGGSMSAALTREELMAALASDDPNVLGSITTNGRTTYFVEVLRQAFREALAKSLAAKNENGAVLSSEDQLAAAARDMLQQAQANADPSDPGSTAGKATQVAATIGTNGAQAAILAFPARPASAAPGESGMLLDVRA